MDATPEREAQEQRPKQHAPPSPHLARLYLAGLSLASAHAECVLHAVQAPEPLPYTLTHDLLAVHDYIERIEYVIRELIASTGRLQDAQSAPDAEDRP